VCTAFTGLVKVTGPAQRKQRDDTGFPATAAKFYPYDFCPLMYHVSSL
jgi:hypothetical protein